MIGYTQIRPLSDCMACVSGSIPTSLYTKKQTDEPSAFFMEQVKGISHYQGRLRRRAAGYAP